MLTVDDLEQQFDRNAVCVALKRAGICSLIIRTTQNGVILDDCKLKTAADLE